MRPQHNPSFTVHRIGLGTDNEGAPLRIQSVPSSAAPSALGTTRGLADIAFPTHNGTPVSSVTAISQDTALGDCYFLSALGELVLQHPDAIAGMIAQNANGTGTVSLSTSLDGSRVGYDQTAYRTVRITVALRPRRSLSPRSRMAS